MTHPELIRAVAILEDRFTQWLVQFRVKHINLLHFKREISGRRAVLRSIFVARASLMCHRSMGVWFDGHLI